MQVGHVLVVSISDCYHRMITRRNQKAEAWNSDERRSAEDETPPPHPPKKSLPWPLIFLPRFDASRFPCQAPAADTAIFLRCLRPPSLPGPIGMGSTRTPPICSIALAAVSFSLFLGIFLSVGFWSFLVRRLVFLCAVYGSGWFVSY